MLRPYIEIMGNVKKEMVLVVEGSVRMNRQGYARLG